LRGQAAVKSGSKVLLAVITAWALSLSMSSAALAHGLAGHEDAAGSQPHPEGPLGVLVLPPEFVLGVVAFFGVLYALKRRRS